MDEIMKQLRRELLRCHLDLASLQNEFSPRDRVAWVAERLEDEVSSWHQFVAAQPERTTTPVVDLPAFGMISLCLDLLERELGAVGAPAAVASRVRTFREQLSNLQSAGSPGGLATRFPFLARLRRPRADLERQRADRLFALAQDVRAAVLAQP